MRAVENRNRLLVRLGISCAVFLVVASLIAQNAHLLLPRKVAQVSLVVPADRYGFFVVPRSASLAPGGRYELVVPPDGICRPIPHDLITFLPSHDTRGRSFLHDVKVDETETFPSDNVRGIWFTHQADGRGDLYFLGTLRQMKRSFLTSGKLVLGFK